ncbi:MAG: chromosome segregation ATPase [Burkholderiales bacterium RIFOXYC12_FULL_65_23]|nr:MAG: chromosome segregation ATPase [Burkholderiales bacterium RIFOXYC12_FULL_65_23]
MLLLVLLVLSVVAWKKESSRAAKLEESFKQATQRAEAQAAGLEELTSTLDAAKGAIAELEPYRTILDTKKEVQRILNVAVEDADRIKQQARDTLNRARESAQMQQADATKLVDAALSQAQAITQRANQEAERTISSANQNAEQLRSEAKEALVKARATVEKRLSEVQNQVTGAHEQAQAIIQKAKQEAEQIAGDAYVAMQKADSLQKTLQAIEGAVKGYGDAYIVPTYSLLDDLADEFSHTDAGNNLRRAREHTRKMVLNRTAASCDYVEPSRRETAISFVTDAFNGKVDSVLSRVKSDNVGKLEQEIRGAFQLVNHSGAAFRNARVTDAYLDARLDELRWAATAKALQDQEREEQRRLREQIREEERARKEFERAMKEAEKEEAAIQKAMEKVQAQVQKASDEQKAVFEAQLAELAEKLRLAEEKGQRALSMAQQTRVGHVYVISNIGSFGENVYKIGMTRRLEPLDRVRELGDASVPFEFDVHAMIYSDDAPKLEKSLHSHFMRAQVNKVNPRKEFFRVGINDIMAHVESNGIQAHWTLTAKAASFRESQRIEQSLLGNTEEGQRWTEIQAETIEADESQEEAEPA